ncbi:MAG: FAD-binding protein [Myxococcaceae bacterium]
MSIQTDVLVVGSGAAGAVALARAKERGLQALGVSKSIGSSGYSSGAIDCFDVSQQAMALFKKITAELAYTPVSQAVSQSGEIKYCQLAQVSQVAELGDVLGVLELSGLPFFRAAPVAKMLKSQGYEAVPITAQIKPIKKVRWNTFLEFARDFENPEVIDDCMDAITQAVQSRSTNLKHIFVPAIFGFRSPLIFLRSLQMRVGAPFSELLGASHSIPGLRLGSILNQGFMADKIVGFERDSKKITHVLLGSGEVIKPKNIILATGRFLSGGFGLTESIFGLPLIKTESFKAGLACDAEQRPLGEFGEVFATNLFAAGSSLGGYDPATDGGMARAIETGYRAGDLC